jgi:hypothetical protein
MRSTLRSSIVNLFAFATLFTTAFTLLSPSDVNAQAKTYPQNNIRNYLFFGTDRLTLNSTNISGSGLLGSSKLISSSASGNLGGGLFSWGSVTLSNGSTINGNVAVKNRTNINPAFGAGSSTVINGKLDVRGNINIKSNGSSISGGYYIPVGATFTGPRTAVRSTDTLINLEDYVPSFPIITTAFPTTTGTLVDNGGVITLQPGILYPAINLAGSKKLVFNGPGTYFIESFNNSGNNTLEYNFIEGSITDGSFKIVVRGAAMMGKINAVYVNAGAATPPQVASKIYTEVQGGAFDMPAHLNQGG